jgi:peptidoglycan/LPS O-acetylase OafA/YrhL
MLLIPIPFFLAGMLTRVFWTRLSRTSLSTVLIGGCIAAAFTGPYKSQIVIWTFFVVAALQEARPAPVSLLRRTLTWITSNWCVTQIGKASYSTYLIHIPLLCVAISLALRIGGSHVQAVVCAATVAMLVALVPISLVLYRFVEKPFMIFGSRRTGGAASQPSSAA